MNLIGWFRTAWRNEGHRAAVLSDYAKVAILRHFLADLALRGSVFAPLPPAKDLYAAGIAEGRRQLALETMRIAGTDPATLQRLCFEPLKQENSR